MNKLTTVLACMLVLSAQAQISFSPIYASDQVAHVSAEIENHEYGHSEMVDLNGDGHLDIIVNGSNYTAISTTVYMNDGNGNMTVKEDHNLTNTASGGIGVGDVDNDGDLDVFINGFDDDLNFYGILHLNQGDATFIPHAHSFNGMGDCTVEIFDADNDGDQDILQIGYLDDWSEAAELYLNDGTGQFSLTAESGIPSSVLTELEILDFNGDGLLDIFYTGYSYNDSSPERIYLNTGGAQWTASSAHGFATTDLFADAADVDGDGDLDILTADLSTLPIKPINLWTNDGTGVFTNSLVIANSDGGGAFIDMNGDDRPEILYFSDDPSEVVIQLNDGTGNYTTTYPQGFDLTEYKSAHVGDLNGDSYQDLFIFTSSDFFTGIALNPLCINNQEMGLMPEQPSPLLTNHYYKQVKYLDLENDGDIDIMTSGDINYMTETFNIYVNQGDGTFVHEESPTISAMRTQNFDVGDINGDGFADVLHMGNSQPFGSEEIITTRVYLNDGTGNFNLSTDHGIHDSRGASYLFDADGDGDLDAYLVSHDGITVGFYGFLYINDGAGHFTAMTGHGLSSGLFTQVIDVDIDADGLQDLIVCQDWYFGDGPKTHIMKNTGTGFVNVASPDLPNLYGNGSLVSMDFDGDGDQDLALAGNSSSEGGRVSLWLNDGAGEYIEADSTGLPSNFIPRLAASDFDSDGDADIVIHGPIDGVNHSSIWENDGTGYFTEIIGHGLTPMRYGHIDAVDLDGDAKDDLVMMAYMFEDGNLNRIYRNTSCLPLASGFSTSACGTYVSDSGIEYDLTGVYEEMMTTAAGCDSLVTIDLTIHSIESTELDWTSCTPVTSPSGLEVWSQSGTYIDVLETINGCDSLINVDFVLEEVLASDWTSDQGVLTAMPDAISYQWFDCSNGMEAIPGATMQQFTPETGGEYAYEWIGEAGCTSISACQSFSVVGLEDLNKIGVVQIWPNPFEHSVSVQFDSPLSGTLRLITLTGQEVLKTTFNSVNKTTFDTDLLPGIYLLEIQTKDGIVVRRLLRE